MCVRWLKVRTNTQILRSPDILREETIPERGQVSEECEDHLNGNLIVYSLGRAERLLIPHYEQTVLVSASRPPYQGYWLRRGGFWGWDSPAMMLATCDFQTKLPKGPGPGGDRLISPYGRSGLLRNEQVAMVGADCVLLIFVIVQSHDRIKLCFLLKNNFGSYSRKFSRKFFLFFVYSCVWVYWKCSVVCIEFSQV